MQGESRHRLDGSRFDPPDQEPLGPLANLVDIMLVFACGLIAALAASQDGLADYTRTGGQPIEQGREIPDMPSIAGEAGAGYESVGKVYRDRKTGKLILIGEEHEQ